MKKNKKVKHFDKTFLLPFTCRKTSKRKKNGEKKFLYLFEKCFLHCNLTHLSLSNDKINLT